MGKNSDSFIIENTGVARNDIENNDDSFRDLPCRVVL